MLKCTIGAASAAALATSAFAGTSGLIATRDNTLYQDALGSLSDGAGPNFYVGETGRGGVRRGLIAFDLSSIPAGAVITNATLTLFMDRTVSGLSTVELHRSLGNWGEGSSNAGIDGGDGAPATPLDATWIHTQYNTSFWTSAGGDYSAAASAATGVSGVGFYSWNSTGLKNDVQAWVSGASPNFGWELLGDEHASGTAKRFVSREGADPSQRPALFVTYTIPTPGVGGVLLCGAGLLTRRRRN